MVKNVEQKLNKLTVYAKELFTLMGDHNYRYDIAHKKALEKAGYTEEEFKAVVEEGSKDEDTEEV